MVKDTLFVEDELLPQLKGKLQILSKALLFSRELLQQFFWQCHMQICGCAMMGGTKDGTITTVD